MLDMNVLIPQIISAVSMIVLFIVIFLFAKAARDWLSPFSINDELTVQDNIAMSVSMAGYFVAVIIIFIGAMLGPSVNLMTDLMMVGGYSLIGIALLNLSAFLNDKLILYQFSNYKEIIEDKNAGTGAVLLGSYIASGMVIAGAVHGEGGGVGTLLVFYLLGQVALILFTWIYNLITPFSIHEEIEKDNVAAGTAFGGTLVALGIILMKGSAGNFVSWSENIQWFVIDSVIAFILLPLVRIIFEKLVIRGADLNMEITRDRNLGAGLLEMTVAIGFASILFFLL